MKSTGKTYKDHLATIRNWARKEAKTTTSKPKKEWQKMETTEYNFNELGRILGDETEKDP